MPSLIFVGDNNACDEELLRHSNSNKILDYETVEYNEQVTISNAREIKGMLSYSQRGNKAFIFRNGLTIESQNALLKLIEESDDHIHFIFFCQKTEEVLPTILSRSLVRPLKRDLSFEKNVYDQVLKLCSMNNPTLSQVDELTSYGKDNLEEVVKILRKIVLDENCEAKLRFKAYKYCKRLLPLISLSRVNNVALNTIFETTFIET